MWITKLKIKHNSRIANRTKKYNVFCYSILLGKYFKKNMPFVSGLHYLIGEENNINKFINDLKKDRGVKKLELKGNVFSMLEHAKTIPSFYLESSIFFVKPVLSSNDGYEYWEIASWEKSVLNKFIENLKKDRINVELRKINKAKLTEVHFPRIMPQLTKSQKRALELATMKGYYKYPRKITLGKLAKDMKIGISTFQEHLRKAENKLFPLFSIE